jgi:hypothetical protein
MNYKKLNKKGQIGKLLSSFPIMLFVFIIMGVFIFVSATFSLGKGGEEPVFAYKVVSQENIMTRSVVIKIEGKDVVLTNLDLAKRYIDLYQACPRTNPVSSSGDPCDKMTRAQNDFCSGLEAVMYEDKNMQKNCVVVIQSSKDDESFTQKIMPVCWKEASLFNQKFSVSNHYGVLSKGVDAFDQTKLSTMQSMGFVKKTYILVEKNGQLERQYLDYYYGPCSENWWDAFT